LLWPPWSRPWRWQSRRPRTRPSTPSASRCLRLPAALVVNAHGKATFSPQDVQGLPRTTYYLVWQVSVQGGAVAYRTGCIPVVLD